ncbi:hypothetical protein [Lapidilactobacillus bayanensis]|uniref:hypothetical protein n=1 Tax=Lapidilactobacillus bayanensis TaxID=2485998 RepID=UPI000F77B957|nr:hypothetical protein [Lapidilactobacillus bayanensis]
MLKPHRKNGFILVESMLCLLSLSAVSLSLAQTIVSGEKSVAVSQNKLTKVRQENQRLKEEIANHET